VFLIHAAPGLAVRRPHRDSGSHPGLRARSAITVVIGLAVVLTAVGGTPAITRAAERPAGATATTPPGVTPAVGSDSTSSTLLGIDVSHWQGTITWSKVAAAGKSFAILKATESTDFVDPMYASYHAGAKAAGLWTGAYHFARPDSSTNDAIHEADHFAAYLNLGAHDLIPALDLEVAGGLSVSALQSWVTSFVGEVTAKVGIRPMIYTSPSFWKTYMGDTRTLADKGYKTLWIAHWGVSAPTVPASNWGGHGWTFWQYDDCGSVSGISGCVDVDKYNGTDLAAQAYSMFRLAAGTGTVKQGATGSASVSILRTNFSAGVTLGVAGLPAGSTAAFATNPATGTTSSLVVTTPSDPAATPVGTYPLTVTGSSGSATASTQLNLVVADGVPPTVTVPLTTLHGARTLGTSTVPVRVTWAASDPSGIASTGLQRSVNGGTWTGTRLPTVAATAADTLIPFGGHARQRVRATDRKGNTSAWRAGSLVKATVFQQTSAYVTWSGTWHTVKSTRASGGSLRYATAHGASATFRFTASSLAWVSTRGTSFGSATVYVDGKYATGVFLHASSGHSRAIVFARSWPTVGVHTLKIVVAGTAGHPRVDVDAFLRLAFS
jgi:GH25 family lysozyme M1 (1,4-beta-N-acetylmuramidase)